MTNKYGRGGFGHPFLGKWSDTAKWFLKYWGSLTDVGNC